MNIRLPIRYQKEERMYIQKKKRFVNESRYFWRKGIFFAKNAIEVLPDLHKIRDRWDFHIPPVFLIEI